MTACSDAPAEVHSAHRARLRWWREALLVIGFYMVYSWIRNQLGSASVSADLAFDNAELTIDIENAMGLYIEPDVQSWFVDLGWFLRFWNIFYGTMHFAVTAFVMVYLYRRHPAHYPRWRTIGLATTALALIGFATFPLMPPRLLGDCGIYGGCVPSPFVDTIEVHGGWVSLSSGAMEAVSNQYAAMPSLHFAWAFWCFLALAPLLRSRLARWALGLYPWLTLFAIVVTANHYWIDAVGGALVLAGGYVIGDRIERHAAARYARRDGADVDRGPAQPAP